MSSLPEYDTELPLHAEPEAAPPGSPLSRDSKRFDIFLIDTGWNKEVSKQVRAHLPIVYEYQRQDSLYLLTPQQSAEILRREPRLIGHDPTIIVYDRFPGEHRKHNRYHGFRLNLGRFKHADQAIGRLQEFIRFLNMHRTAANLDQEVRRELHREGLRGMVKTLREAKSELL